MESELLQHNSVNQVAFRLAPFVVWFIVLWTAEILFTRVISGKYRHAIRNLSLATTNGVLLYFTIGTLTIAASLFSEEHSIGALHRFAFHPLIRGVAAFLLLDFYSYAWHWINHHSRFL